MLLEVEELTISFRGAPPVVDSVSFTIESDGRLAVIGESGSGKSLTALAVIGLLPPGANASGSIRFEGTELLGQSDGALSRLRGEKIAMVFQNPLTSLNPLMRVGRQIAEPLTKHRGLKRRAALEAAIELCARVGLPDPDRIVQSYPHQLSGGQRQRIGIAIAIACRPALLIADEPTTALDVTVQAEVLKVFAALLDLEDTASLFITHDVALVPDIADDLLVMREGRVVEHRPVAELIADPEADYTKALLAAARKTAL